MSLSPEEIVGSPEYDRHEFKEQIFNFLFFVGPKGVFPRRGIGEKLGRFNSVEEFLGWYAAAKKSAPTKPKFIDCGPPLNHETHTASRYESQVDYDDWAG